MGKKVKWNWTSALVGAATATAAVALISAKPKDPTFHVIKINLSSFKLKFPIIDTDLILTGSQRSKSCQTLELTARLNGVELMTRHAAKFFSDVAKREMVLDARVDIGGTASLLWWGHRFNVHVDSHITVDPVFLDIIDQENKSSLEVFLA
ncbi:hypothetical protein OIU77_017241 [Salix suchowensis]|uniref:Late embryogenesis abundant protein LEA-2 subgroup domain-containing protein n=1 Tax=Salix suchowensis TaxID=1278906 RepID=A0ABQ8ZNL2_9ROSI|nr:hypothetical protein OIU77_017241 [Salix suchowensis]